MRRRQFILGAVAAAVNAALPGGDGVTLQSMAHPSAGFGLAPLKAEGASIAYDYQTFKIADPSGTRYAAALAKSMLETKEISIANTFERMFPDSGEGARRSVGGGGSPDRV